MARVARAVGRAIALLATFVVMTALGAVLHLGLAPARRILGAVVNDVLADTFHGTLAIQRVGALHLDRVDGVDATIFTYEGEPVAHVRGLAARVSLGPLVWSLLRGGGLRIRIPEISIADADVRLERTPEGQLTIAAAFEPAESGPPTPGTPGPGAQVELRAVTLRHARIHAALGSSPPIDASVTDLAGSFETAPDRTSANVSFRANVRDVTVLARARLDRDFASASIHAEPRRGAIDLDGSVALATDAHPDMDATLRLTARGVDASDFGGPESAIDVNVGADARVASNGAIEGGYAVEGLAGFIAGQAIPVTKIEGRFTERRTIGSAHAAEIGAPIDLRYDVAFASKGGPDVTFELAARASDLRGVPRLRGAVHEVTRGEARVNASGRVSLGSGALSAKVTARADDLASGQVDVEHALAGVTVGGTLANPRASSKVSATGLRVLSSSFSSLDVAASGTLDDLAVDARLARGSDALTVHAASIRARGGHVDAEGLTVTGAGAPLTGEAHVAPGVVALKAASDGLDVGRVASFLRGASSKGRGRVALDADLRATPRGTDGHLRVHATHASDGRYLADLAADVDATFMDRHAVLHVDARDPRIGSVTIDTANAELAAGALDPRAWRDARGDARVTFAVDLARAGALSLYDLPLDDVRGAVSAAIEVKRDDARRRPSIAVDAWTRGLGFTLRRLVPPEVDGAIVQKEPPRRWEKLDARVQGALDAATGDTVVALDLHDDVGAPVAAVEAKSTLPIGDLLAGDVRSALLGTRISLHAEAPIRSLQKLPSIAGASPVHGDVGLTFDADGSARDFRATLEAKARNIVDPTDASPVPLSFDAKATYDGRQAHLVLVGARPEGRALDGDMTLKMAANDLLDGVPQPAWDANADVTLHELPLGAVTNLVSPDIAGNASGTITLRGLHDAASLHAKLDLDSVVLAGSKLPHAHVVLDVADGSLAADARVDQSAAGFADVQVTARATWGADLAPSFDDAQPVDVHLVAKRFRARAIAPFVQGAVSDLDGVLDADTRLHIAPGFKDGNMDGAILVDQGRVEVDAIGQELHDVKARIFMKPWGVWNVQEISGRAISGRFTANAIARLNGFHLKAAEAHFVIPEGETMPITMQGTALGTAWGRIDAKATATPDGREFLAEVDVPTLHADLEDATGHAVQSIDPDSTVRVGVHAHDGTMTLLAYDGTKPLPPKPTSGPPPAAPQSIRITTKLGPDVQIRRGGMLKIYVTKGPVVDIGRETKISGAINVPRGYIELQGKRFQVERGTVTFTGQPPDDPVVVATAAYESPDGTKVIADFVGPVKTGKLTLRSEPALSQNEILALLLFGSADGTFGQAAPPGQQGNDTTQAASLAGGLVTEGLNKAISGVSSLDVQTKVDTEQSGNPRPEVEVALSRKVSATVIYNLGIPPPGQNPDDTLLLVDWRFHRRYSTEVTVGDKGTTIVDLTWKYRY